MIDGLKYLMRLEAAGVSRDQAQAEIEVMTDILKTELVTREQFATANLEIRTDFAKVRAEFVELRNDFSGLRGEFSKLRDEFATLRIEFAEVQKAVAKLASDLGSIENRLLLKQAGLMVAIFTAYALAKNIFHF